MQNTRLTLEALRRSVLEQAMWATERAKRAQLERLERVVATVLAEQAEEADAERAA